MKFLIISIGLLLSNKTYSAVSGGDEVRNGGGIAEQYLTYSLKKLPRSIDICLQSIMCASDSKQRELLKKIKASIPLELQSEILQFTSNQKRPGLFTINGVERLAVTADYVGAPIYYNTSMLYKYDDVRITLGGAIQSLIHELGHHHGVVDHDFLEVLGSEVRKSVEQRYLEVPYHLQPSSSVLKKIGLKAISGASSLLKDKDNGTLEILFKDKTVDVTSDFNFLNNECDVSKDKPILRSSFQFFNLYWIYKADEQTSGDKYLAGNIMLSCHDKYSRVHKKNFEFTLKIKTTFDKTFIYQSHEFSSAPSFLYTEHIKLFREVGKL